MPNVVVLVASARALKFHGGVRQRDLGDPNVEAVHAGGPNLAHHIGIVRSFNLPVVVAVNRFPTDTPEELAAVAEIAHAAGPSPPNATASSRAALAARSWRRRSWPPSSMPRT